MAKPTEKAEAFVLEFPVEAHDVAQGSAGNPFKIQGRLLNLLRDKLIASIAMPSKEQVLKAAGEAFDKYVVVALNAVPYIPDALEPLVDKAAKDAFLAIVGRVYDSLAKSRVATA